ncbi:family 78 glycoside hydrolase catalytic domain [Deinococcus pimensis]|uniref:family 78 glycoside hydrolase catalytic domain n=1 Tax=Deinococcus pimensis TaxID=309888 RepID=UPI000488B89F|nr:family 78 glycoside hydrolase catalytic domain [Deinococcus pimensis]
MRGTFDLPEAGRVTFRLLGASWYVAWLDGTFVGEGPARFPAALAEVEEVLVDLTAGRHVLAVQVHHAGVATTVMPDLPPFLNAAVRVDDQEVEVTWRARILRGYRPGVRRVNPELGWIEWCDTRLDPDGWRDPAFDDGRWSRTVPAPAAVIGTAPLSIGRVRHETHVLTALAGGSFTEEFGYDRDDPPVAFLLRDLAARGGVNGSWRRYDLGRVRLGRPSFTLDVPEGTVVQFGYAERLNGGRVAPFIPQSLGPSCHLDHYVARGGVQTFEPLTPRGLRFLEVHVLAPRSAARFVRDVFVERTYHGAPEGTFTSSDARLDRVWQVGVDTHRACCEDALTDCPSRERGQWVGDAAGTGLEVAAVTYSDLRLVRRNLVHAAVCAREDGLVAGLTPGMTGYLPTYAAQWTAACLRYALLADDQDFLVELWDAARRNAAAFEPHVTPEGLLDGLGWAFIDWGFDRGADPVNLPLSLHYLEMLRGLTVWAAKLGYADDAAAYAVRALQLEAGVRPALRLDSRVDVPRRYHAVALALRLGLYDADAEQAARAVQVVKAQWCASFPYDPLAPRHRTAVLPDEHHRARPPTDVCVVTPYFAHFAFPALIERGELDFVLEQVRTAWGWALDQGLTTWPEAFDTRWSHCHQWSAAPTWLLSRYLLGLLPRPDATAWHFDLVARPGDLSYAAGRVPLPGGHGVDVRWDRAGQVVTYRLSSSTEVHVRTPEGHEHTLTPNCASVLAVAPARTHAAHSRSETEARSNPEGGGWKAP